jgi:hypothetical protein
MATSVRQLIFENIQTALRTITNRNGYNYNVESDNVVIIHGKRDDSAFAEPIIYIYPGHEVLNPDMCEKGKDFLELEVIIEAFIRGARSEMNANINKMLADIKKALGADHTRGGYALDTVFLSNDAFLVDLTGEKCGIIVNMKVDYEHAYGLPDTQ